MAKKVLTDLDLQGNKLQNATIEGANSTMVVGFDANGYMTAVVPSSGGADLTSVEQRLDTIEAAIPSTASANNMLVAEDLISAVGKSGDYEDLQNAPDLSDFVTSTDLSGYAESGDVPTSAEFDNSTKTISFKNGENVLFTLNASAFVVDGMVDDAEITNGNLVITFNTDAGKQDITIPVTDIFNASNYYTKTDIDNAGYQTNAIEGITLDGEPVTVTNKIAALTSPAGLGEYVFNCLNYTSSTYKTIPASEHGCGTTPYVMTMQNGQVVDTAVAVNASGDVTVSWGIAEEVSSSNPLTVIIVGKTVSAVTEQQPLVGVNPADYPKLAFTKTGNGTASVAGNKNYSGWQYDKDWWENADRTVTIPEAVELNGETLLITEVAEEGFRALEGLRTVNMQNTQITKIGIMAFEGCVYLNTVNYPPTLTEICESAFEMTGFDEVRIPRGVTTIGGSAYTMANIDSRISRGYVPNSVTTAGWHIIGAEDVYIEHASAPAGWDEYAISSDYEAHWGATLPY